MKQSFVCFLLTLSAALAIPAHGQPLSGRAIKIVVPFGAGGVADLTARTVAQKMSDNMMLLLKF